MIHHSCPHDKTSCYSSKKSFRMSFIEMVTIQKGGVLQWQRTKMKKEKQNKQQNKPETGN